jgi:hypothetical protein
MIVLKASKIMALGLSTPLRNRYIRVRNNCALELAPIGD